MYRGFQIRILAPHLWGRRISFMEERIPGTQEPLGWGFSRGCGWACGGWGAEWEGVPGRP